MVCSVHCPHSFARYHLQCRIGASHPALLRSRRCSRQGRAYRLTTYAAPVAVSTGHHTAQADAQDCSSRDRLHATDAVDSNGDGPSTSGRQQHIAVFRAKKFASMPLREGQRPLAEYMTLPASQYSVLDAKQIERIDEDTFRCYVGGLRFLSFVIEPVLTVSVIVTDMGPTVKLLSTELRGSPAVEAANEKFTATMTNEVRWGAQPASELLELRSNTSIQVALEVPGWFRAIPLGALERTGCSVMQRVLDRMVPRFLAQLQQDYALWASGDESRKPIGAGEL